MGGGLGEGLSVQDGGKCVALEVLHAASATDLGGARPPRLLAQDRPPQSQLQGDVEADVALEETYLKMIC